MNEHGGMEQCHCGDCMAREYTRETEREARQWAREQTQARREREIRRSVRAFRVIRARFGIGGGR